MDRGRLISLIKGNLGCLARNKVIPKEENKSH